ncbi:MAG: hypothetical protein ACI4UO_01105 [Paludibacteraceae bacterium]
MKVKVRIVGIIIVSIKPTSSSVLDWQKSRNVYHLSICRYTMSNLRTKFIGIQHMFLQGKLL